MVKIILVSFSINIINPIKRNHLWKYLMQQAGIKQIIKADGWFWRQNDLVQFICYALPGNDTNSFDMALYCLYCRFINFEIQLCRKPYGAHHPERVVRKSFGRVQRRTDKFTFQVAQAVKRVQKLTTRIRV